MKKNKDVTYMNKCPNCKKNDAYHIEVYFRCTRCNHPYSFKKRDEKEAVTIIEK